jgi:4-diphosphocytidyl-2-C-methyl-D-erythritol kinase
MKILTPAKINLTLEIIGRRSDGYHDLATLMLPVGLYDSVAIEFAATPSFFSNVPELKQDSLNLVIRAVEIFRRAVPVDAAYEIRLEKGIPLGAGLGGGSSDGAATLLLLNALHGLPLSRSEIHRLAADLGSDVAFFIDARSAWCRSRGEIMEPREFPRGLWVLLTKPGFGVSTAGAYRAYASSPDVRKTGREITTPWGKLRNDLEGAVFPKYLLLPVIKDWLTKQPDTILSLMSGSGSAIFAVLRSQSEGETMEAAFRQVFGERIWTAVCRLNPEPMSAEPGLSPQKRPADGENCA